MHLQYFFERFCYAKILSPCDKSLVKILIGGIRFPNSTDHIFLESRSIDDAKNTYLPQTVVKTAQLQYVSPYAVSDLWGRSGYRFVLSRSVCNNKREIIGTALITEKKGTLLFYTNKYHNLRFSIMDKIIDPKLCVKDDHEWFSKFKMPEIHQYKPIGYNQLANFAVEKIGCRGMGLGKLLIEEITKNYAIKYENVTINHSQPMIYGKGLFQIADPSWRSFMLNIGFKQRYGAETFYVDKEWDRLLPVYINNQFTDIPTFNKLFGMPMLYNNIDPTNLDKNIHLIDRIAEVIELSKSENMKLQYFQFFYAFDDLKK